MLTHVFAMRFRFFPAVLSIVGLCAIGCGGESGSLPPADHPSTPTNPDPNVGGAPEKAVENAPTNKDEPGQTTPPADSKVATSDKPVSNDKPAAKDDSPSAASEIPDANLTIGRIEADGLVTTNITCKGDGGGLGLLSMMLVTAWMGPHKKALDACAPPGKEAETRIIWRASQGKITAIEAKSDSKNVKACVEKTLRPGKPVFEGHCAATLVHGKAK